jgi:biotin carboxylase
MTRKAARPESAPGPWFALLESNTSGTGRDFCATARARGLRPVLLAENPGRYPYVAQDRVDTRILDTRDPAAILAACAALADHGGLAGITSSSEYFVSAAARAAAEFGLPAADPDAIARCRAKDAQRAALAEAGIPVPAFAAADTVTQALQAASAIGHPVVLKPVNGSGSVGVRMCRDPDEVRWWAGELLSRTSDERGSPVPARILTEAAVMGSEFSVETFDDTVVVVVAKHLGPEPYFVETGHDVPAPVPDAVARALADTARDALAALRLGWGAAHTELRLSADGPVVIEVNPRLAGGMIPVAVRAAIGIDLVDAVIARCCAQAPAPPVPGAGHAAIRFLQADREGRVAKVEGLAEARAVPGVVAVTANTAQGHSVRITQSFLDRLACVVASGTHADQAAKSAHAALGLVRVCVEPTALGRA